MSKNFSFKYEVSSQDSNFPARVILFDKPGKDCYIDKHWHKTIEINYVLRGDLMVEVQGEKEIISKNQYKIINSCDVHHSKGKYDDVNVRFLVIMYSNVFIKHYFPDFEKYRFEITDEAVQEEIREQLDAIVYSINSEEQLAEMHILAALISVLDIVFSKCGVLRESDQISFNEADVFDYSRRAIEYMKDHYQEKLTLESVAENVGLTPTYFAAYFKKKTNKSFLVYLNDIRMQHVIADIQAYDMSETRAALNNGFPNVKSYITTFKRNYNCTPSQYVKEYGALPKIYGYNKTFEKNHFV